MSVYRDQARGRIQCQIRTQVGNFLPTDQLAPLTFSTVRKVPRPSMPPST